MKRLVRKILRRTIGAPTPWLALGVASLCASLALSYHRAQIEADYAMAMRLGPPEAVAIADATPRAAGEGHVLARFDPERAVRMETVTEGEAVQWLAVPLFSVPEDAAPVDGPTRPRARPETVAGPETALGIALFAADGPGPEAMLKDGARYFDGALNGAMRGPDTIGVDGRSALTRAGTALSDRFVVIEPWIGGRAVAFAQPSESRLPTYLFWIGVASVLASVGLSLWPEEQDRYLDMRPSEPERRVITRSRVKSDAHRFNPIIGQDDIRRGAMERLAAAERAQGRTPSTFHTNGSAPKVGGAWVRNRR